MSLASKWLLTACLGALGALLAPPAGAYPLEARPAWPREDASRAQSVARPHGPPPSFSPAPGEPVFRVSIPAIGLREVVYHGTEQAQLARGPGHYPSCGEHFRPPYCAPFEEVWPGERGRSVIGGHRTLAGAEFIDLGRLRRGDLVRVQTSWGTFRYRIFDRAVVHPLDRSIIVDGVHGRQLLLVTCHPKGSAARRLLYYARLEARS